MDQDEQSREQFLSHEERLRELAERLVEDRDRAEDLVQETYLAALAKRLFSARWLNETLRLKARQTRSGERRRRRRERVAAVPEGDAPRVDEGEERLELLTAVSEEVAKLDEPYRTTLRMRFLEEVPPREIARAADVPIRTVYTRVSRGLKLLRERLDHRFGALVWVPALREVVGSSASGAALRWSARAAGLVVAFTISLAVVWWLARPSSTPDAERLTGVDAGTDTQEVLVDPPTTSEADERLAVSALDRDDRATSPRAVLHRGRILDPEGSPLADIPIIIETGEMISEPGAITYSDFRVDEVIETGESSDELGRFALSIDPELNGRLIANGEGHVPVIAEYLPAAPREEELVLIAGRERSIEGSVLDELGRPVAEVSVRYRPSVAYVAGIERFERSWMFTIAESVTGEDGRFELMDGYHIDAARLQLTRTGFVPRTVTLDDSTRVIGDLILEQETSQRIRGRVLDENDRPVAGALVVAGIGRTLSDASGDFELEPEGLESTNTIWAIAHSRMPARLDVVWSADGTPDLPDVVVLRVAGEPLTIEGRILDAEGNPLTGASAWVYDPTAPGADLGAWFVEPRLDPADAIGVPHLFPADDEGRFRVSFLIDRDYRLGAILRDGGIYSFSAPIAAGSKDVELRVPTDQPLETVVGRIVTRDGRPVPSARIRLQLVAVKVRMPDERNFFARLSGRYVDVNQRGEFDFPPLPLDGYRISASGDSILETDMKIPGGAERRALEIVADRPARLRITCSSIDPPPTHAMLFGANRRRVGVYSAVQFDKTLDLNPLPLARFENGTTDLLIVPDTAATLQLFRGETIVHESELDLRVDDVNVIEI